MYYKKRTPRYSYLSAPVIITIICSAVLFTLMDVRSVRSVISSGNCSDCHTMHNSQDDAPMAYKLNATLTGFEPDRTENEVLLISDCIGCHTSTTSSTIVNGTPIVFNTDTLNDPLASGNFQYVRTNDMFGHNVSGIEAEDLNLGITPPGGPALSSQLTCAGELGCHGNRSAGNNEYIAMQGTHHTDDTGGITGASVGLSYRFLNGILGGEDDDWEQDNTNTSHNEYKGSSASASDTISYFCARCHGDFHTWTGGPTETGTASPWLRHPTDIVLNGAGEYASYTNYSMVAPLARPDPGTVADTTKVTPGTDIVMCLSCHRAHAAPYFKLLRWDYKNTDLSVALSGCNVCHTSKN